MVEFYSHVVASTPEDRSSCCWIWHYGKSSFPSMCTASFLGFLTSGCCTRCHCSDLLYNSLKYIQIGANGGVLWGSPLGILNLGTLIRSHETNFSRGDGTYN